jgi:hypothetical protein
MLTAYTKSSDSPHRPPPTANVQAPTRNCTHNRTASVTPPADRVGSRWRPRPNPRHCRRQPAAKAQKPRPLPHKNSHLLNTHRYPQTTTSSVVVQHNSLPDAIVCRRAPGPSRRRNRSAGIRWRAPQDRPTARPPRLRLARRHVKQSHRHLPGAPRPRPSRRPHLARPSASCGATGCAPADFSTARTSLTLTPANSAIAVKVSPRSSMRDNAAMPSWRCS